MQIEFNIFLKYVFKVYKYKMVNIKKCKIKHNNMLTYKINPC